MALSDQQIKDYYASQSAAAKPLSPAEYEASLRTTPAPTPAPAPPAPSSYTPPSTSTTTPTSDYYPRYTSNESAASTYLDTFKAPETEDQIFQRKQAAAQAEIDSINRVFDDRLAEQRVINEGRDRGTQSVNVMAGLAGSTDANNAVDRTSKVNQRENTAIQNERAATISAVFSKVRSAAAEEARAQREEARMSATEILTRRKEKQKEAVGQLTELAKAGTTVDGLKGSDPKTYQYLADMAGGEEQLRAIMTLNRPQESILDKKIVNGSYVISFSNPLTGKVRVETVDLNLPPEYTKSFDAGGSIIFAPDGWQGDTSQLISIPKTLTPAQATSGGGSDDQLYSGLKSTTATAVRSKVTSFKSEPLVQNFATIQEGYNFANSLDTKTTNPADDQALIYSLAKALDPGSVVREGEYATAQKYAQSWIAAYGKGVTQALVGTGFLSEAARKNIKKTIEQKYEASKKSYDNIYSQYTSSINNLTGRGDGKMFLTDYATPSTGGGGSKLLVDASGQTFDASELTEEEYQQAIADGYKPQ